MTIRKNMNFAILGSLIIQFTINQNRLIKEVVFPFNAHIGHGTAP